MITVPQETWDTLFGWMTGKQCFLPEGCGLYIPGVIIYLVLIAAIVAAVWKREQIQRWFTDTFR